MGHEGEAALDAGLPVFFWNPNGTKIPLGMRPLAERPLDDSLDAAVKQLAAYRAAPMSLLDRHLSRLFRFIKRMPGCPTWSDVLLAENIRDNDNFDSLLSPAAYTERFAQLLASRPWVNLHAVGLLQRTLVVSIEASGDARPRETDASVQLSGPENRVTAETGWKLALRHDG
jgi:hypothetical protein